MLFELWLKQAFFGLNSYFPWLLSLRTQNHNIQFESHTKLVFVLNVVRTTNDEMRYIVYLCIYAYSTKSNFVKTYVRLNAQFFIVTHGWSLGFDYEDAQSMALYKLNTILTQIFWCGERVMWAS